MTWIVFFIYNIFLYTYYLGFVKMSFKYVDRTLVYINTVESTKAELSDTKTNFILTFYLRRFVYILNPHVTDYT